MENSLNIVEEIMKPYFEKEEEIRPLMNPQTEYKKFEEQMKTLMENEYEQFKEQMESERVQALEPLSLEYLRVNTSLNNLKDKKEKEINDYIEQSINSRTFLYAGYVSSMRKDLEDAYNLQEKMFTDRLEQIKNEEQEINNVYDKKIKEKEEELNNSYDKKTKEKEEEINDKLKYKRVYVKEILDLKSKIKSKLIQEYNKQQLEFDTVMLEIRRINASSKENVDALVLKKLFEKSNVFSESLLKIREYLRLMEPTEEENKMHTNLAPWEMAEYERRQAATTDLLNDKVSEIEEFEEMPSITNDNFSIEDPEQNSIIEMPMPILEPELSNSKDNDFVFSKPDEEELKKIEVPNNDFNLKEEDSIKEDQLIYMDDGVVENYNDLIDIIYDDIKDNIHKFNIEETQTLSPNEGEIILPSGVYANTDDIYKALKKYKKQEKGRTFLVKDKVLNIADLSVKKIKKAFKEVSTISLLSEGKIGKINVVRMFGKAKADAYEKAAQEREYIELTDNKNLVKTSNPVGEYANEQELLELMKSSLEGSIKSLFKEKRTGWLKRISNKFKNLPNNYRNYHEYEADDFVSTDENTLKYEDIYSTSEEQEKYQKTK